MQLQDGGDTFCSTYIRSLTVSLQSFLHFVNFAEQKSGWYYVLFLQLGGILLLPSLWCLSSASGNTGWTICTSCNSIHFALEKRLLHQFVEQNDLYMYICICVSKFGHDRSSQWSVTCSAPNNYLNQYWRIINPAPKNILQLIFILHSNVFIWENVVCEMSAILFGPCCIYSW